MTGEDIKRLRKRLGMSQAEFGEKIGASRQTVVNYENGGKVPEAKLALLKDLAGTNRIDIGKKESLYFEKEGVRFYLEEIAVFLARNEEEAMSDTIINNMIEGKVSKRLLEITSSKSSFLEYLGDKKA